jgi:hypothetical protein
MKVMFRIAYVLDNGSFVGKAAAITLITLIVGIPLLFIVYTEVKILIDKIKKYNRNKKERN